jgi:acetoin utilization deacetylase AcuC-like enzyme
VPVRWRVRIAGVEIFTDARCLGHRVPFGFPEVPERLQGIVAALDPGAPVARRGGHPDAEERLVGVHGEEYLHRFRRSVERGDGILDSADNPLVSDTWEAARGAVDAALHAADSAAAGRAAFAAVRPPGHHAERHLAMGFCYFNNAAVAAEHLRGRHGCQRVAIFDFDVHHGNGTQHLFEDDPLVFYASVHQFPFYPGTGAAPETGRGAGKGATLNVPLPAGCGDEEYEQAIRGSVLPAVRRFGPDALVVSAGFDAWAGDPLGGMRVSERAFRSWGEWLAEVAGEVCEGRFLSILEGGYDLEVLPRLVGGYLAGCGWRTERLTFVQSSG